MESSSAAKAFLLSTSYRDNRGRFEIALYGKTEDGVPIKVIIDGFRPLFFVPRQTPPAFTSAASERKALPMKSLDHQEVDCLYFPTYRECARTAESLRASGVPVYESDINPVDRFLMERGVRGGFRVEGRIEYRGSHCYAYNPRIRGYGVSVDLTVMAIDIETNVSTGEIYSIACAGKSKKTFIRGELIEHPEMVACPNERQLLQVFFEHIGREDPDIIIGWNVIDFDLSVIQSRCDELSVPFLLGRANTARVLPSSGNHRFAVVRVQGRVVLDVPTMLRAQFYNFESYSLDNVAEQVLGKAKLISQTGAEKIAEIDRLFSEDKKALAEYNLEDSQLTLDIFKKTGILQNAVARSKLSGHLLDRLGGSVAAFDFLYLPALHRKGYVAKNTIDAERSDRLLPGGYVMDSVPGLHENVLLLDFKSLYPSLIMTFRIDPLGLHSESKSRVRGPAGPSFATDQTLLPGIIENLMQARAEAKKRRNPHLSQAVKILMNSFYGVLGTPGCRFFSYDLASTITETGRCILKMTSKYIEEHFGKKVIYGDTDSLFILLGSQAQGNAQATGKEIVSEVNGWLTAELKKVYGVEPALELEFETHFRHFFMPTVRGGTQGSKKRYCGAIENQNGDLQLMFKGLESARTDWTQLSREFQHELYMRIFRNQPVEDYIQRTIQRVRSGEVDEMLVYRKKINKPLSQYVGTAPPHVQAARLLDVQPRAISYYITVEGPQPVEKRHAPLDYDHYITAQIQPIAESILESKGLDFESIVTGQQDLFG